MRTALRLLYSFDHQGAGVHQSYMSISDFLRPIFQADGANFVCRVDSKVLISFRQCLCRVKASALHLTPCIRVTECNTCCETRHYLCLYHCQCVDNLMCQLWQTCFNPMATLSTCETYSNFALANTPVSAIHARCNRLCPSHFCFQARLHGVMKTALESINA